VPFVWHVSDYATQMSCAMFRGIGRPDWPLRCAVGERRITNAQALSDRPAKRKELVDGNRYHHITLRCQDRNSVLAYGAPTELLPARRLADFTR
jgi:hypothetical protein